MYSFSATDTDPLYRQLYHQMREKILTGRLPAHHRLPSIRDLAEELKISRNTVDGAFQELCAEGYIYSKTRSGYFVSAIEPEAAKAAIKKIPSRDLHPRPAERHRFDFHPARLDPAVFPTTAWRRCLTDALRSGTEAFSEYSDPQGEWGLRCNIQFYLEHSRGVRCNPDQIIISSGLQQNLEIVAQLVREQHQGVAVENPGYHLPRDLFRNLGFNVHPVDIGSASLNPDHLQSGEAGIVYITPSHQLPLGYVMPVADRLKLISWAGSGNRLIIEDDYDSELRYTGRPIPSLQGLNPQGNIIYQGTFSKVFSPALRLCYMVLPVALAKVYREKFRNYLPTVPLLTQRAMIAFMEQGHWDQHLRRVRTFYKKKHDLMLQSIRKEFGSSVEVIGQGAGLHLVLQLKKRLPDEAGFVARARDAGCRLLPFSAFYADGRKEDRSLLVGFGGIPAKEIPAGIKLLAGLIEQEKRWTEGADREG